MGAKYQNFSNGVSLEAKASAENISKGDLEVTFADGKLNYHNGTSSSPIVTESHTATLTNKTLTSPVINSGTLTTPILGTPVSGNLQNCTLPLSTLTDLNSNVKTFLITPSSANLAAAVIGTTGSGDLVFSNSPSLTTPNVGVATATSINKLSITAPASGATLTIADGKTLTASNTLTFTGTDSSSVAFSAGGTVAYVADKLSVFASTTSAELAGVISNETGFNAGTGNLVFSNEPVLTTPQINAINVNGTYTVTLPTAAPAASQSLVHVGSNVYEWKETNKVPTITKILNNASTNGTTITVAGQYNPPSNTKYIRVRMVGGGGAGGSESADAGGGGGGGAYLEFIVYNPTGTYTYIVGGGGNGVNLNDGNNGGYTSFTNPSSQINRANGGSGGKNGTNQGGGAGGTYVFAYGIGFGTIGQGGSGGGGGATFMCGGAGGSSMLGGGAPSPNYNLQGISATDNTGGGGSGSSANATGGVKGGDGGSGIIIIEEYYNY